VRRNADYEADVLEHLEMMGDEIGGKPQHLRHLRRGTIRYGDLIHDGESVRVRQGSVLLRPTP